MRNTINSRVAIAVPLLAVMLAGCWIEGDGLGDRSCDGVTKIQNSTDAAMAAGDIASSIEAAALQRSNGTFTGESFPGNTGTISIVGDIVSSTVSCGTGCLETTNNHSITVELANYSFAAGDATITGPVIYGDTTVYKDDNAVISITGNISIFNGVLDSSISYDSTVTDPLCNSTLNGLLDTISEINSIGLTTLSSDQIGFLTASLGDFNF